MPGRVRDGLPEHRTKSHLPARIGERITAMILTAVIPSGNVLRLSDDNSEFPSADRNSC